MIRGLHLSYEESLRELCLLKPKKRTTRKSLLWPVNTYKGSFEKEREGLFTGSCRERRKCTVFKQREGRFRLDTKKNFFVLFFKYYYVGDEALEQVARDP